MRQQWIAPASLIAALLIVIATVITPPGSTLAMWFKELTTDELSAQTDRYTLDFADVPSTSESTNPAQPPVWNQPSFTVTNESSTLAREMRITRAQLTSRYTYSDSDLEPVRNSRITFALAPAGQTCMSEREQVWTVKETEEAPPANGIFTPPAGDATFMLAAGETRHMCIDVALNTASSTVDERRTLLRSFAGAGIKAVTDIGPAQTLSTDGRESGSVTSLYRVGLPQPAPSTAITSQHGTPGCRLGYVSDVRGYMKLQWAWPDGSGHSDAVTPVVDRWEIWSKPSGGSWSKIDTGRFLRSYESRLDGGYYEGGNIPADKREVFLERGVIRGPTLFPSAVHRDFVVVGVLKNSAQTRFVATRAWDISWDGAASPFFSQYHCHSTFPAPANLTGAPNVPGRQW